MNMKTHIIIFSHGYGVRKDDLGMLTDIATAFPDAECVLFDYFNVDEEKKTLTVTPFSEQARKLTEVYKKTRNENPNAIIDVIGHSQGVFIPALANLEGVRKTILLNPPFDMGMERTLKRYGNRTDCEINLGGLSRLYPVGGYLRLVPKEYWTERKDLKSPVDIFNEYSKKTDLTIINANQDTILGEADFSGLNANIKVFNLDGDHNFNGAERENLKKVLLEIICN